MNHNEETHRAASIPIRRCLFPLQCGIIATESPTNRLTTSARQNKTWKVGNRVCIARHHDGRRKRRTGPWQRLLVVRCTLVTAKPCQVAGESEMARTGEFELLWCRLFRRRERERQCTRFEQRKLSVDFVRDFEVDDSAHISGNDDTNRNVSICSVWRRFGNWHETIWGDGSGAHGVLATGRTGRSNTERRW